MSGDYIFTSSAQIILVTDFSLPPLSEEIDKGETDGDYHMTDVDTSEHLQYFDTNCESGVVKSANGNRLKMKLRDFMVNSLPRVRSKKKHKQQLQQQQQQHANQNHALSNGSVDANRNTYKTLSTADSGCDVSQTTFTHEIPPFRNISPEVIRSELDELRIEKSRFKDSIETINFNVISDSTDSKFLCFKHIGNSYGQNDVVLGLGLSFCADEDGLFTFDPLRESYSYNTVPKARSKIRTNPWCNPSPKSTPTSSPASSPSPNSSSSNSPSLTPTEGRSCRPRDSSSVSDMSTEGYSSGHVSGSASCNNSADAIPELDCLDNNGCKTFENNNNNSSSNNNFTETETDVQFDIIAVHSESEIMNAKPLITKEITYNIQGEEPRREERSTSTSAESDTDKQLEHRISFEYEETLDSLLEDEKTKNGSCVSIQDLYEEGSCDDSCVNCSILSSGSFGMGDDFRFHDEASSDEGTVDISFMESSCDRSSSMFESLDSSCSSLTHPESAEDFTCFRSRESLSESDGPTQEDISMSARSGGTFEGGPSEGAAMSLDQSTTRSLGEVKASLEEKVLRLRQEKLLVEKKIREAQEEDRIRQREKLRFQKQLTLHRKQILLKTLQELRGKLEKQSCRLQDSYTAILNVQRRFGQRNSALNVTGLRSKALVGVLAE